MIENTKQSNWKNRIVGYGEKPAKDFRLNPKNWRDHPEIQRNALNAVLEEVGWVTGVIENERTGNLIDGEARIKEALEKSEETLIPFTRVDLSEKEEAQILLFFDRISAMATAKPDMLEELASQVSFESDLLNQIVETMKVDLVNLDDFFIPVPEPAEMMPVELAETLFTIELHFPDETDYRKVLEKLNEIDKNSAAAVKKLLDL